MSSSTSQRPVFRLEIDYPDIRLVAPDLPEPLNVADLASPDLASGLAAICGRLRRERADCILVLPESQVWRASLASSDGITDDALHDQARAAAATVLNADPEDIEVLLDRSGGEKRIPVAAVSHATLAESAAYLLKAGIEPVGITGAGDFPGFAAEPVFGGKRRRSIPNVATLLATTRDRMLPAMARIRNTTDRLRAAPLPNAANWMRWVPVKLPNLDGQRRIVALAAGAACLALIAGWAILQAPAEETEIALAPTPEVRTAVLPAEPRTDRSDSSVIFPVDPDAAATIKPLRAATPKSESDDAAPVERTAAKPPIAAPATTAKSVRPLAVTIATRNLPPARPVTSQPSDAAQSGAFVTAAGVAPEPALSQQATSNLRPMRRTTIAPTNAVAPVAVTSAAPTADATPAPSAAGLRPRPRAALTPVVTPTVETGAATETRASSDAAPAATIAGLVSIAQSSPPKRRSLPPTPVAKAAAPAAIAVARATPTPAVAVRAAPQPVKATPAVATRAAPKPIAASQPAPATLTRATNENVGLSRRDISLIGVFGPSSSRHALLRLPNGSVHKVQRGDTIQGVQVAAVDQSSVRLRGRQRDTLLKLPD